MPSNAWEIGALYFKKYNNIDWQQPGGVGGLVYPQQQTGVNLLSIQPFSELTGLMTSPCGHMFNEPLIQREYDYDTSESAALLLCPLCSFTISAIEPFEEALSTVTYPYLVA